MDSDNILSILAALGGGQSVPGGITPVTYQPLPDPSAQAPTNVLQAIAAPPPVPTTPQAPPTPPPAAPVEAAHPRKRLSVIDIIGRLADTVATVGGSQPMYLPTLEHAEDRMNQVDMDALKKRLTVAEVGEAELNPVLAARKRIGTALGALANNPDAAALWPSIAEQAGIDPQHTAAIGEILTKSPNAAGIFAKALGADVNNLGKNVYFGTDATGKTVAYQVGPDGAPHILDFSAAGVTPSDPIKVIDTGGSSVIVGASGAPKRVLPKTVRPDTVLTTTTQRDIAAGHDRTQLEIASMPARSQGTGKTGDNSAFIATAQGNLDELRKIYGDLKKMGAMVSDKQSAGANISARVRASGIGQTLEGAVGTRAQTQRARVASIRPALMQAIAKATGMTGKQLDSNADVKLFMQTVTDPAAPYESNIAAIDGLERFLKANAKKPTAAPVKTVQSNSDGWSIVGVK